MLFQLVIFSPKADPSGLAMFSEREFLLQIMPNSTCLQFIGENIGKYIFRFFVKCRLKSIRNQDIYVASGLILCFSETSLLPT